MNNDTKPEGSYEPPAVLQPAPPVIMSTPPVPVPAAPSAPLSATAVPAASATEPEAAPEETTLNEAPEDMHALPHPIPSRRPIVRMLMALIAVIVVGAVGVGAFQIGNNKGYARGKTAMQQTAATLKVPVGASVVAQCTAGEGMQYIAPKDIPMGPIYNVWKGNVVGLEYMLPESDIAKGKGLDLAALSQQYDHVDVAYEAEGHAGLTEPHYHIMLSTLTYEQEKQITCGGSTTNVHDMDTNMGM